MPDFLTCIKDKNGNTWCWDNETNSVVRVVLDKPVVSTIPQEVLVQMLEVMAARTAKEA